MAEESEGLLRTMSGPSATTYLINAIMLSVSFLLAFIAFSGVQNLESSLDLGEVSGKTAVAIIYIVFTVACILGRQMVIFFGARNCILIQEIIFVLFIASQVYPRVWTVYPAAGLLGVGASAMWVAQGEYMTFLSVQYARRKHLSDGAALGLFQGLFFGIYQLSQIAGNLVSSLVLQSHKAKDDKHSDLLTSDSNVSDHTLHTLLIIYIACIGAGIVVLLLGVKSIASLKRHSGSLYEPIVAHTDKAPPPQSILGNTLGLLITPAMSLIVPMFLANGLAAGFIWGDFTGTIIKDSVGEENIGYVMAVFGAVDALTSVAVGKMSDVLGRPVIFLVAFIAHGGAVIWLLVYHTPQGDYRSLYPLAAVFGVGDAIWNTVISATLSACFRSETEAAFSCFKMWQSVGIAAAFFYNDYLALDHKLYILGAVLILAAVCYVINLSVVRLEKRAIQYDEN